MKNNISEYLNSPAGKKRRLVECYNMALMIRSPEECVKIYGKTFEEVKKEADEEGHKEWKQITSSRIISKFNNLIELIKENNEYLDNTIIRIDENGQFDVTKATKLTKIT